MRRLCPFDTCAHPTLVPSDTCDQRQLCLTTLVPTDTCAYRHLCLRHLCSRHLCPRHLCLRHLCPRHLCPRHLCPQHLCPRQYCVHCIIFFCYQSTHNSTVCLPFICCIFCLLAPVRRQFSFLFQNSQHIIANCSLGFCCFPTTKLSFEYPLRNFADPAQEYDFFHS